MQHWTHSNPPASRISKKCARTWVNMLLCNRHLSCSVRPICDPCSSEVYLAPRASTIKSSTATPFCRGVTICLPMISSYCFSRDDRSKIIINQCTDFQYDCSRKSHICREGRTNPLKWEISGALLSFTWSSEPRVGRAPPPGRAEVLLVSVGDTIDAVLCIRKSCSSAQLHVRKKPFVGCCRLPYLSARLLIFAHIYASREEIQGRHLGNCSGCEKSGVYWQVPRVSQKAEDLLMGQVDESAVDWHWGAFRPLLSVFVLTS